MCSSCIQRSQGQEEKFQHEASLSDVQHNREEGRDRSESVLNSLPPCCSWQPLNRTRMTNLLLTYELSATENKPLTYTTHTSRWGSELGIGSDRFEQIKVNFGRHTPSSHNYRWWASLRPWQVAAPIDEPVNCVLYGKVEALWHQSCVWLLQASTWGFGVDARLPPHFLDLTALVLRHKMIRKNRIK
jgi:hypothetical protein